MLFCVTASSSSIVKSTVVHRMSLLISTASSVSFQENHYRRKVVQLPPWTKNKQDLIFLSNCWTVPCKYSLHMSTVAPLGHLIQWGDLLQTHDHLLASERFSLRDPETLRPHNNITKTDIFMFNRQNIITKTKPFLSPTLTTTLNKLMNLFL